MTIRNHVHKYVRAVGRETHKNKDSGMKLYFKCAFSNCSHYTRDFLILGKNSICNRCGEEFTLTTDINGLLNRPHCKKCTRVPKRVHKIGSINPGKSIVDKQVAADFGLSELDIEMEMGEEE